MNKSKWKLLLQKEIINILVGNQEVSSVRVKDLSGQRYNDYNATSEYRMPYLSGPDIVGISNKFGLSATYEKPQKSRWQYMSDLISYCIAKDKMQQLITFLLSVSQFKNQLTDGYLQTPKQVNDTYQLIFTEIIRKINIQLAFGGNSLEVTESGVFYISENGETPNIEVVSLKQINAAYIKDISDRALRDIGNLEYDSAITKSRTLLEEVFCFIIEENGEEPSDNGDIGKLYNQVKGLYDMHQKKEVDKRINNLLSGLEKILSSIGGMRNKAGDAHGAGSKRYIIDEHHARLFVNSAIIFAEFILSVHLKAKK